MTSLDMSQDASKVSAGSGRALAEIPASELRVGDVLVHLSTPHLIAEIRPYDHPTVPGCLGIARAADGFEISLWPLLRLEIAR